MAADPAPIDLPHGPISIEEVHRRLPAVRQSLLATFDNCNLSALFSMRSGWGFGSPEAAVGTLFHRVAEECMRTMVATGENSIPVSEALEVMYEVAAQRDVEPWNRVIVPARLWPRLRLCVIKFAKDNEFTISKIVDIEERLTAEVPYQMPDGSLTTRKITGQPDILMWDPPDGALVLDYKTGFGLPPAPRVEESEGFQTSEKDAARNLSWTGYYQQRFYSLLVFKAYPRIQKVTLREFYVMRNAVRQATIYRADIETVEREISIGLEQLDRAIAAGPRWAGTGTSRDPWPAQPGKACRWCAKANHCPIETDARAFKAIASPEEATRAAAEFAVADGVRQRTRDALKDWLEFNGPTIPVRNAKGRSVIGWNIKEDGSQRFEVFTPSASDKGINPPDLPESDARLEEAFGAALEGAVAEKSKRRVARKQRRKVLDK